MNRTLVIGDIHGGFKALKQALVRAKVTTQDRLIFLGDYVDGWSESAQLIEFLIELEKNNQCIFILGNHDLWCKQWLEKGATNAIWLEHGGRETQKSYIESGLVTNKEYLDFFKRMKNYYLDDQNRLFVHAGFTSMHGAQHEVNDSDYYFDRTLWETARMITYISEEKKTNLNTRLDKHYEIFIVHTPTTNYGIRTPIQASNLWNIDTGAAFKGRLTMLDINSKEYWQSDPVFELYTNEKGRN